MQNYIDIIKKTEFIFDNKSVTIDVFICRLVKKLRSISKLYIIGNGASSSMASHYATDFTKNGGISAESLNDGAMLTCFINDFGFESSYTEMLKHKKLSKKDLLIAISSSGNSNNVVNAVNYALSNGVTCLTLSGFNKDNLLQKSKANYKIYSPGNTYGSIEVAHNAWLHYILDKVAK